MGAEIGNYMQGCHVRWTIEKEEDIGQVSELVFEAFQKVALPYYDAYNQLEQAFALLKRNDDKARINCPFGNKRTKNALALAVILKRTDEIDLIIEESLRDMHQYGKEIDIADFSRFKENLTSNGLI